MLAPSLVLPQLEFVDCFDLFSGDGPDDHILALMTHCQEYVSLGTPADFGEVCQSLIWVLLWVLHLCYFLLDWPYIRTRLPEQLEKSHLVFKCSGNQVGCLRLWYQLWSNLALKGWVLTIADG